MTLDLFSLNPAQPRNYHHSDPVTSKEAGIAARSFIKSDQSEILRALEAGPMACEEISNFLGWGDHVRANRRMKELVRAGLIERSNEKHINRSGCGAFKYRLKSETLGEI
jgi:helix-turn-helix protein